MKKFNTDSPNLLDEVLAQRNAKLEQIREKKLLIRRMANEVFMPQAPIGKYASILSNVNKAMAIFDGVMTGIKLMHRVRKALRR